MDSIEKAMMANGMDEQDIDTLRLFATIGLRESDGTPKPALAVWDQLRQANR
jgi:hypothetical protein